MSLLLAWQKPQVQGQVGNDKAVQSLGWVSGDARWHIGQCLHGAGLSQRSLVPCSVDLELTPAQPVFYFMLISWMSVSHSVHPSASHGPAERGGGSCPGLTASPAIRRLCSLLGGGRDTLELAAQPFSSLRKLSSLFNSASAFSTSETSPR